MFSGIVESVQKVKSAEFGDSSLRFQVVRPVEFDDLKIGDSIACNGVCLTLESFDSATMTFCYGAESLRLLKLDLQKVLVATLNLERSLRFGDRVHGHLVTGHVEDLAQVVESKANGDSWELKIHVSSSLSQFLWFKGGVTVHGVSLTINSVEKASDSSSDVIVSVCLIPETILRTNLSALKAGDLVHIEPDYLAKALWHQYGAQKSLGITL